MNKKTRTWFILLLLALIALALTFALPQKPSEPPAPTIAPVASPTAVPASPTAAPTASPIPTPTAEPTPTRRECVEPEPVLFSARDRNGTPLPPPVGAGGVIKIGAAPCTRELALRDFAEIFRFWSNVDGNPFQRHPGWDERGNYFVQGQPAYEMWSFNNRYYAENRAGYIIWEPRGYEPEKVEAVYQDPAGTTVWIFYRRGTVTTELHSFKDDSVVETFTADLALMRWMLQWQDGRYKAVSYESRINSLP